jgi:hypothetical protein
MALSEQQLEMCESNASMRQALGRPIWMSLRLPESRAPLMGNDPLVTPGTIAIRVF